MNQQEIMAAIVQDISGSLGPNEEENIILAQRYMRGLTEDVVCKVRIDTTENKDD